MSERATNALRESEARFRAIFEKAGIGMALADMDGRLVESNPTFQQMLGYDAQELRGMVFTEFTHPEDATVDMTFYKELEARKRHHYQIEKRYIRKDGQLVYGRLTVSLAHGKGAKPQFAIGMVEDITARKQAEEALRDSESRFRTTFESAAIPMVLGNMQGGFIETNPAFRKLFGYSAEELASLKFTQITHPEDIEKGWDLFKQLVAGTISTLQIEKRYIRKDGSVILANTSATAIHDSQGRLLHTVAMVQDITASRQAEEALLASESRFRGLLEAEPDGVVVVNEAGCIDLVNTKAAQMFGYRREELLGEPIELLVPQRLREEHVGHRTAFLSHPEARPMGTELEVTGRRKDGSEFPADVSLSPLETDQGLFVMSIVRDITERKRAELALRQSEERFRVIFESAPFGMVVVDAAGTHTRYNRAFQEMLGYTEAELQARDVAEYTYPDDVDETKRLFGELCEGKRDLYQIEKRYVRKDGRIVWGSLAFTSVRDTQGDVQYLIATVKDITERKRAEEQARQLQADLAHMSRLSSMGEMATGLAHELNQPLTVITNYAQGCVRRLKANAISQEELEGILGRIATQARRSSSIIRGLGNLVRKSSALRTDIDVNQSIMEVAELANAEAAQHRVKALFELEPNLPPVKADQTQLQQVILNLVQNGCEAIEDVPRRRREVTVRTKQRGNSQIEIAVSDRGAGIPENLSERLFEPFFTTKARGIGMGLAISRSIVESHGGRLWATPNRGGGTTFHFTLPIAGGGDGDE